MKKNRLPQMDITEEQKKGLEEIKKQHKKSYCCLVREGIDLVIAKYEV